MILILESSTTSAKAMLFDPSAGVVKMASETYPAAVYDTGEAGSHDAQAIYLQTIQLGRQLCENEKIEAIVPCGTWHNVLVCDRNMQPLTPAYSWTYNGAAQIVAELRESEAYTNSFYQRTGCMVHTIYPAFKLLALQQKGVDLSGTYISSQSSYMFYHLTGCRLATDAIASGSGLLNVQTRDWDPDVLAQIGIEKSQLGRLTTYKETAPLSAQAAKLLGLTPGIPVLPAYPDGALNQVGAGALESGVMTFSVGTSGALRLSTPKPVLPEKPGTWCYLSPNAWLSGAATSGACNCVDWIKDLLFSGVSYKDVEQIPVSYQKMPIFLPFIFGERSPGWNDENRGEFCELHYSHSPPDLYFSVLEGVLFNLYQCYQILCSVWGEPKHIHLSGGITNSKKWKQMCCDIFGREMMCARVPHTSMVGGAVLAMEATGHIARIEDYSVETTETLYPDHQMHQMFQERFQRYTSLYTNLQVKSQSGF